MPITKQPIREIIEDFAAEIRSRKSRTAKPSTEVINFRSEMKDNFEREVFRVPVDLLRFRKNNGRISSDVADHEKYVGPLSETDDGAQEIIASFLGEKDPEKTGVLRRSVIHSGQQKAAIITSDGFLIDGNRRKLVLDMLHKEFPQDESFAFMKVVILPGKGDPGGPPTLLEIEKLENRYQLQSDGKSEYYGFDRALSIKRKIEIGLSLEDQLRDDPRYAESSPSELERAVREVKKRYLEPLECADRYLAQFRRVGHYRTISKGMSDPEGRWQALVDYSDIYSRYFSNPKKLIEIGVEEDEIGSIEEAAFDMIRLRTIEDMPKVHTIMRNLPKYCSTREGKREITKIAEDVDPTLPDNECRDATGMPLSTEEIDAKWATKFKRPIIHRLKKAAKRHETKKERETPLDLLDSAYKKLTHDNMDLGAMNATDVHRAREIAAAIKVRADELESDLYRLEKDYKKLLGKNK